MLCALTVRNLKPGTFDQFREAFMSVIDPDNPPAGFVRFDMLRNMDNPDQVICFGFFDGSVATNVELSFTHFASWRVVRRSADSTRSQPCIGRPRMIAIVAGGVSTRRLVSSGSTRTSAPP